MQEYLGIFWEFSGLQRAVEFSMFKYPVEAVWEGAEHAIVSIWMELNKLEFKTEKQREKSMG